MPGPPRLPEPRPCATALSVDGAAAIARAVERGAAYLCSRQQPDGSWNGDYSGPLFLLPMYVAAAHACGRKTPCDLGEGMARHLLRAQLAEGALGLHSEARQGSMFTTVLGYLALRLLGRPPEEPALVRMRGWMLARGGALAAPSWAKFVLAVLGLYDYSGLNPILPELYRLPPGMPLHPRVLWCHARQVYLPMAYLYGRKARAPEDHLLASLRREIYDRPYDTIRFRDHRDAVYPEDCYRPPSPLGRAATVAARFYERVHSGGLRQRAIATVLEHVEHEDRSTDYIRLGPVNAILNTLVQHFHDPAGEGLARSWQALAEYLWLEGDEVRMNGQNSTRVWDTCFAGLALLAAPVSGQRRAAIVAAYRLVAGAQILQGPPLECEHFRHPAHGGWPFPLPSNGWPVSDCTAEALKLLLAMEARVEDPVPEERLTTAVDFILSLQNRDGGWGTYERQRAGRWLEWLNPSQVFADIMVDASRVENTSSCLQALAAARARLPAHRAPEALRAIAHGSRYLRRQQRADGSWEGFWGICFTYGTWFGVLGLLAGGSGADDPAIQRAADFLLAHQRPDGGWGEAYESCLERRYRPDAEAHPVQTAWALMTLVAAGRAAGPETCAAARWLAAAQTASGDWPRGTMVGVFNRTTLIHYDNYRRYFCLWALAEFTQA